MSIENDKTYKKLLAHKMMLDTIFTLNSMNERLRQAELLRQETTKIVESLNVTITFPLIKKLVDDREKELIDWTSLKNPASLNEMRVLKTAYPDEIDKIRTIESDITFMSLNCGILFPFHIVTMIFLERWGHLLSPNVRDFLHIQMATVLQHIHYDRESLERKYLSKNCSSLLWYEAYFFENSTVPSEEHTFLLNELLKNVFKNKINLSEELDTLITKHLNQKECTITEETLRRILNTQDIDRKCKLKMLYGIRESSRDLPISLKDYVNSFFLSFEENEELSELYGLFESLYFLAPLSTWLPIFMRKLIFLPNSRSIMDHLRTYIKNDFPLEVSDFLENEVLVATEENLRVERKKLIYTLKAIQERKTN